VPVPDSGTAVTVALQAAFSHQPRRAGCSLTWPAPTGTNLRSPNHSDPDIATSLAG
jgi:hypothetical protein